MELLLNGKAAGAAQVVVCWGEPCPPPYGEQMERLISAGRFRPQEGQVKALETEDGLLILAGKPEKEDARLVKQLLGRAVRLAREERAGTLEIDLDSWPGEMAGAELVRAAAIAAWEGNYVFDRYRSKDDPGLERVSIKRSGEGLERAFQEGDRLGRNVAAARDTINRTSRDMTPETMAGWVLELAKDGPYEVEILDEEALRAAGAVAMLSVSAGAHNPPRMAVLRYRGNPEHPDDVTGVLGKGLTYDSGGLSLKTKKGMITMHHDMSGAAVTAAAFDAAARMGLPVNLTAVLPMCENMLAPQGYRPGDVIGTMDGKTVLVTSTDAEGRLVLADALTWAIRKEGAKRLVDIATLTGGAVAAFGPLIHAVAVEDTELIRAVQEASDTSGEPVWRMPMLADYKSYLKAEHADLANSSGGAGPSMINGAMFLREFTQSLPWLHIDCAGPSWTEKTDGCRFWGATGAGTALLFELFRQLAEK